VVCRSVTIVSAAKTAELIKKPFGMLTQVGPRNHMSDGGPDPCTQWGNFDKENWWPIVKYRDALP